ncbi:sensor histidine kinase [Mesorhizobium sp. M00.F.Ca.ET.216.01.1.1]|uniref:sensor histidine kinase n=1 Tax=Mesorhizobium sp. M00.F.Ca.ET.216.01.1.1 TaxID=2500528 RepID=UPI000FDB5C2A|nr:sensor histidine kinase [Mesorhizobium sp. M00.F.Ca.ET.216.01.1.1]TGQ32771.1 sensor histidine kinase [Mesorhizobium sp. M00.F.Ca.ET.216.01.1.1]TJW06513.1 MAG: sensor histidine kinase [Mesorhizobium sp.]TJW42373.1 MAG: sensor histidine kinase [Mesorhizobium sp.]
MMPHSTSLFARLMRRVGVVLALGAAALITAAWFYARTAANEAYDRLQLGAAFQMSEGLVVADGSLHFVLPPSAFELLGLAQRDRIFYRVVDPSGTTLTGYPDLAPKIDLAASRIGPIFTNGSYLGVAVRNVAVSRAMSMPQGTGWAYVVVAQTTEARQALASELTTRAVILVAIMSLVAVIGTALAVRYSLQPVGDLGAALRRRDPQDLTPLTVSVPDELSPFVTSINHFITRLDERVKLLQRYIADSAHQIRTPLTALSAQVSLIDEEKLAPDDRRHLQRVQSRTTELARLTNQLLNHAMVIHRFDSIHLEPVALNDVARKALRNAVPITVDPDIVVSFEPADEELTVLGDMLSLREAIANVIDNALRHGVAAHLEVHVRQRGNFGVVDVLDDGPGIQAADWAQVTSRFYSSRSDAEGASGLGFAIASEVAVKLGGQLRFRERTATELFCVSIELPLANGGS